MGDTSPTFDTSTSAPAEKTASHAVAYAEEDRFVPPADENAPRGEADEPAGHAGGKVGRSIPALPNELVDCIVSHLPSDNKHQLALCCRVSRTFLASARPRLYHTLELQLAVRPAYFTQEYSLTPLPSTWTLYQTLLRHRSFTKLVKKLSLEPAVYGKVNLTSMWMDFMEGTDDKDRPPQHLVDQWFQDLDINLLLKLCSNLEVLLWAPVDAFGEGWREYAYITRCLDGVEFPTLRSLSLAVISQTITSIAPNLAVLDVLLNVDDDAFLVPTHSDHTPCLDTLVFGEPYSEVPVRVHEIFTWLTGRSNNTLRVLDTFWHKDFHPSTRIFTNLTSLSIDLIVGWNIPYIWSMPTFLASLKSFPTSLRELTITDCGYHPASERNNLSETFLVCLPSGLQHLTFSASLFGPAVWPAFVSAKQEYMPNVEDLRLMEYSQHAEAQVDLQALGQKQGLIVTFSSG
ncbi:hypothetical protein JCM11251_003421 [Rhodosporidiobolus azoricus]